MVQNVEIEKTGQLSPEQTVRQETSQEVQSAPETESVVERIERDLSGTQKQTQADVQTDVGQILIQQPSPQPAVTLPVTQDDMVTGAKLPLTSAFYWLVAWCRRQIRKYNGQVSYTQKSGEER